MDLIRTTLATIRVIFLLACSSLLCQCSTAVTTPEAAAPAPVLKGEHKKIANPYSKPTASYIRQAQKQEGVEKQQSLFKAAGHLISEGQLRQGAAILSQTSDLSPQLQDEKKLLLAQIDLMHDRPKSALTKLMNIADNQSFPLYQQIKFHELLAQAYRDEGNKLSSINERIKLDSLLLDEESKINNHRSLWFTLSRLPQTELESLSVKESNVQLQGWIQLALISHKFQNHPNSLVSDLKQWQTQYPNHPAQQILPNPLDSVVNKLHPQPKKIALLLPLSGPLQGPGTAVQDGFMAAYQNNHSEAPIQLKTYDTNQADAVSLYQNALDEGADYIVGPLTKAQVAAVAALPHPVPTLLLNDADTPLQENSYTLGLSPINEAVQVAIRAKNKGYSKALIIAPGNEWGKEVSKAFTQQWEQGGGRVVDSFLYGMNEDLNKKMKDFLQISNSQQREKKIRELLGQKIQPLIGRRQDFDMIFLLAYPSKARQIMPLLNYYYAGDVPVYATASVYGGSANPLKDKDLDGIIFCDIPWVFAHQAGTRNWPEQFNSYNRLYALGVDSFTLATQLNQLILFPADQSKNGDGILYLKPTQQIARVLEWGQFNQGLVHSLGETV